MGFMLSIQTARRSISSSEGSAVRQECRLDRSKRRADREGIHRPAMERSLPIENANMRFGILGSAQANSDDLGPETGQGFHDYLEKAVEAEALGYHSSFLVEHHFTGWNQVTAPLMLQTALA